MKTTFDIIITVIGLALFIYIVAFKVYRMHKHPTWKSIVKDLRAMLCDWLLFQAFKIDPKRFIERPVDETKMAGTKPGEKIVYGGLDNSKGVDFIIEDYAQTIDAAVKQTAHETEMEILLDIAESRKFKDGGTINKPVEQQQSFGEILREGMDRRDGKLLETKHCPECGDEMIPLVHPTIGPRWLCVNKITYHDKKIFH